MSAATDALLEVAEWVLEFRVPVGLTTVSVVALEALAKAVAEVKSEQQGPPESSAKEGA